MCCFFLTCAPAVPYFNQNASTDMYNSLTLLTNYAMIGMIYCVSSPHNADYVVSIPKPLNAGAGESWSHIFCVYLESDLRNKEEKD